MRLFRRIGARLTAIFGREPWRAELVSELPEALVQRKLYLVGEDAQSAWFAAMLCPCGCREVIQLSLIPKDEPRWEAVVEPENRATLHPSVWRIRGCRSHFILRGGKIHWCKHGRPQHGRPALGQAPRRRLSNSVQSLGGSRRRCGPDMMFETR